MLYVGGGAGMAPMRSRLYELFRTLKNLKIVLLFGDGGAFQKRACSTSGRFQSLRKRLSRIFCFSAAPCPNLHGGRQLENQRRTCMAKVLDLKALFINVLLTTTSITIEAQKTQRFISVGHP